MNEGRESVGNKHILVLIGEGFAPIRREWLRGKTVAHPSTLGCGTGPPQAVENRKIIGVLIRFKIALFSAGNELAKMGNTLGQFRHQV